MRKKIYTSRLGFTTACALLASLATILLASPFSGAESSVSTAKTHRNCLMVTRPWASAHRVYLGPPLSSVVVRHGGRIIDRDDDGIWTSGDGDWVVTIVHGVGDAGTKRHPRDLLYLTAYRRDRKTGSICLSVSMRA